MVFTAFEYEKLHFDDIPDDLLRNHKGFASYGIRHNRLRANECSFFDMKDYKRFLEDDEIKWEWLPEYLVDNSEFASTISDFSKNADLPKEILGRFDNFRGDRSFWRKLLQCPKIAASTYEVLREYGNMDLFSDRKFMLEICRVREIGRAHV